MNQAKTLGVGLLLVAAALLTIAMPAFAVAEVATDTGEISVDTESEPAEIQQEYADTAESTETNQSATVSLVPQGETNISQGETDVPQGTEVTLDVVVEGATDGISVLDMVFTLDGEAGATFTDFSLNKTSSTDGSVIKADGSEAFFNVALLDNTYEGADEHTVGEVTVAGHQQGTVTVDAHSDSRLYDLNVSAYTLTSNATEFTTTEEIDVIGTGTAADNTTGDGLLDDVTGSGELTIADVQAFFTAMDRPVVQSNAERFDFAGFDDSQVTIFDVQALFNRMQGELP